MTLINTIKTICLLGFLSLLFMGVTTTTAQANTVVRSGDSISISEEQVIDGDFYSAANTINISGAVESDLILAGGQVMINGTVGNDALILAVSTDVHGTIGEDLRIISGEVTIAEPVMGDLFIIGGTVNILSTASITGDVLVYASDVTIAGSVGGNILGRIETLRIDTDVAGDVDVTVTELTLGDRANIQGSVKYISNELAIQAQEATVVGDLIRNDPVLSRNDIPAGSALVPVLVILFSVLVWFMISRRTLDKVVNRALSKSVRPISFGFLTIFFAPMAAAVLVMSMIGTLVGFVGFSIYILFILLSLIALPAVLGQLFVKMFNQPVSRPSLFSLAVGVVGVVLLMLLPVIGPALVLLLLIVTLGAIVDTVIRPEVK